MLGCPKHHGVNQYNEIEDDSQQRKQVLSVFDPLLQIGIHGFAGGEYRDEPQEVITEVVHKRKAVSEDAYNLKGHGFARSEDARHALYFIQESEQPEHLPSRGYALLDVVLNQNALHVICGLATSVLSR